MLKWGDYVQISLEKIGGFDKRVYICTIKYTICGNYEKGLFDDIRGAIRLECEGAE